VRFGSIAQTHPYQRDEIFGPEAALYPVDDLDEAIAAVNDSDFGLAAAVITRDRATFDHCAGRVQTGILNWNRGTIGASGNPLAVAHGEHRPRAFSISMPRAQAISNTRPLTEVAASRSRGEGERQDL
jgi:hypothetical protein